MIQRFAILTLAVSISLCSAAIANPGTEYPGTALSTDEYRFAVYDFLWGTGAEEGMIAGVATGFHGCRPLRDSALDFVPSLKFEEVFNIQRCVIHVESDSELGIELMELIEEQNTDVETGNRFHFYIGKYF